MDEDTYIAVYDSLYAGISVAVSTNGFVDILATNLVNERAARRYAEDASWGLAVQEVVDFTEKP